MIIEGDCLTVMKDMADNSIDFLISDPPYGLNFMGKKWDQSVIGIEYWKEAIRICKPGAMLAIFGGTRTYHRLTCAVEDSGFEIRDCIMWVTGQGFPKSHNFGCKCRGLPVPYNHEEATEQKTKSFMRSMSKTDISQTFTTCSTKNEIMFQSLQKQNLQSNWTSSEHGNEIGKESCLEGRSDLQKEQGQLYRSKVCEMPDRIYSDGQKGRIHNGASASDGQASKSNTSKSGSCSSQRSQYAEQSNRESGTIREQSSPQDRRGQTCETCKGVIGFDGWGTALKPSYEPIILAMKPLDGTFAQNAEKWGVAGINIDDSRIGQNPAFINRPRGPKSNLISQLDGHKTLSTGGNGRWPANLILDEEAGQALDQQSGNNASRFFYCAKASATERNKGLEDMPFIRSGTERMNNSKDTKEKLGESDRLTLTKNPHPTVKPIALMKYLITLLAPPGNPTLLDPFAGSGTTLLAAKQLGIDAIGIEIDPEYCEIARKRCEEITIPETIPR